MLDLIQKIELARSKANQSGAAALEHLQDEQRFTFLDRLHVVAQDVEKFIDGVTIITHAKIRLSDWEKHFVAGLVREKRPLTPAQRKKVDELRHRYQSRI